MTVSALYKIKGVGRVITGVVLQGQYRINVSALKFIPLSPTRLSHLTAEISWRYTEVIKAGEYVGISPELYRDLPKIGDIIVAESEIDGNTIKEVKYFTAEIYVQFHPGKLKEAKIYNGGYTPMVFTKAGRSQCSIQQIIWKQGKSTDNVRIENTDYIEQGDRAVVVFEPKQTLIVLPFDECKTLGRIVVMDHNALIMIGKVIKIDMQ